jgi:poly-gamma-glutamate synthesis protein (capsule biosynthesis protein)
MHIKIIVAIVGAALAFLAIVSISLAKSEPRISTVIVPHHNLVAKERGELFSNIAHRLQNKRIILLSTNHYNVGSPYIQTISADFSTANGMVQIDKDLITIAKDNGANESPITFETEHGVKTILPDIAYYLPKATILPLIIKEDTPKTKLVKVIDALHSSCADCIVIASVDFSHYQPYLLSELHDDVTRRAMQNLDISLVEQKAELGEPLVLASALQWAQLSGTTKYVEYNHTNATEIENNFYAEGTTHFFSWYEVGHKTKSDSEVTFTFAGDMMFDRKIRDRFHPNYKEIFAKLGDRVLWGTDIVMANLEGPITKEPKTITANDMPRFAFSPLVSSALNELHITDVALRNNHIFDAGSKGVEDTHRNLSSVNIYTTNGNNPRIVYGNNQKIILYNLDATQNDKLPTESFVAHNSASDNIVVYIHWGPEYQPSPSSIQTELAHALIDAGADMVIGVGPHVIQPAELYKNRPIIYSLGNFIFDMSDNEQTVKGLILAGKFTDREIVLQPMITESVQLQPLLLRSRNSDTVIGKYFESMKRFITDTKGGVQFTITK